MNEQLDALRRESHQQWRTTEGVRQGSRPTSQVPVIVISDGEEEEEDVVVVRETAPPDTCGDEELARRLQEEMDREDERMGRSENTEEQEEEGDDRLSRGAGESSTSTRPVAAPGTETGGILGSVFTLASHWLPFAGAMASSVVGAAATVGLGAYALSTSLLQQRHPNGENESQMESDEALARRLQAEEDAQGSVSETPSAITEQQRTLRRIASSSPRSSTQAIQNLLSSLGGFVTRQQQTQSQRGTVNDFILPFYGGIRIQLVQSSQGSAGGGNRPTVIPMPFNMGGAPGEVGIHFGEHMTYEQLLELQESMGFAHRGASEDQISSLPLRSFKKEERGYGCQSSEGGCVGCSSSNDAEGGEKGAEAEASNEHTCAICLEDYQPGQQVRTLPCMHNFHSACVDKWLKSNKSCPLCKHDIC